MKQLKDDLNAYLDGTILTGAAVAGVGHIGANLLRQGLKKAGVKAGATKKEIALQSYTGVQKTLDYGINAFTGTNLLTADELIALEAKAKEYAALGDDDWKDILPGLITAAEKTKSQS